MTSTKTRRRSMTEQAADAAIDQACRSLRLPTMRTQFGPIAAAAERDQLTYRGFLAELLMAECEDRDQRRTFRRIKEAGFPRPKSLADFDYDANPNINPATIHTLSSCGWIRAGQPLCLIGDSGTGKSHLLIGLGTAAAEAGFRVRYTLAAKLVNELAEAAGDRQLSKTIARYGRVDLLCIDELLSQESVRGGRDRPLAPAERGDNRGAVARKAEQRRSVWSVVACSRTTRRRVRRLRR